MTDRPGARLRCLFRGRVKAHDRNQAIANIRAQGLYPTALGEMKGEATSEKKVPCKKPKSHLLKNALAAIGKKLIAISESM